MKLILEKIETETTLIKLMTFQSASQVALPAYSAGAHIEFDLNTSGKRSYSLIDWPQQIDLSQQPQAQRSKGYTVAVQLERDGGGGSKAMHKLTVGQVIEATPPQNDFPLTDNDGPVLLLAGGIGITPIISMATQLQQQGREFQLHYSARDASRMGFANVLKAAFSDAVTLYCDDTNPLNIAELMRSQHASTSTYLCGPKAMIESARTAAIDAGLAEQAIHIELFSTPEAQEGDTAFEVEINSTGQVITVAADQTIIQALEAAGVDVMYDCQRGDCGICQCDVVSGVPDHRDVVLSNDERAAGNVMQICVSRAKSARLVIEL